MEGHHPAAQIRIDRQIFIDVDADLSREIEAFWPVANHPVVPARDQAVEFRPRVVGT